MASESCFLFFLSFTDGWLTCRLPPPRTWFKPSKAQTLLHPLCLNSFLVRARLVGLPAAHASDTNNMAFTSTTVFTADDSATAATVEPAFENLLLGWTLRKDFIMAMRFAEITDRGLFVSLDTASLSFRSLQIKTERRSTTRVSPHSLTSKRSEKNSQTETCNQKLWHELPALQKSTSKYSRTQKGVDKLPSF